MNQRFSIILIIGCLSTLVTIAHINAFQNQISSNTLTTQRLTDVAATTHDVDYHVIIGGRNSAHVLWVEYTVFNPLEPAYDSDTFYVHLPLGQVQHLKATTGTVTYGPFASSPKIAIDSNNHAHIIWSECAENRERSDLYLTQSF
jgi:hypothetical protein